MTRIAHAAAAPLVSQGFHKGRRLYGRCPDALPSSSKAATLVIQDR